MSTTVATERAAPVERDRKCLNILFVTPWYPTKENIYYGVFVRELAKAAQTCNRMVVLHLGGADQALPNWWATQQEADPILTEGIPTYRALYRPVPIRGCSWPRKWMGIRQAARVLCKEHGPFDLIHGHIYTAGPAALSIGRRYQVPVVLSEHSSAFPRGTLPRSNVRQARRVFEKASAVLPVSHWLQKSIEQHGIKARFHVVPNPVNTDLFNFEAPPEPSSSVRLLIVASLVPVKGLDFLLQALRQTRWSGRPWHLEIVGSGPHGPEYQKMAEELGLSAHVTFHGSMSKTEIARLMRQTDLFILSSLFETFSVATAEALAAGVPALVTACGGPQEFVDGQCGVVVKPGDATELANGLMQMVSQLDKYDRKEIARKAKERFGYEAVAAELTDVYTQVTNGRCK